MPARPIQAQFGDKVVQAFADIADPEQFGERMIEAFTDFARADIGTPDELEQHEFAHVSDLRLRRALAQTYYGTRWLYKLGLALLTRNEERAAHVRAQILDYGSVCEGLLSHCVLHAVEHGHTVGQSYQFSDPDHQHRPISWANPLHQVSLRKFWWLVRISQEFGISTNQLSAELHWLRTERNSVHLRRRASQTQNAALRDSMRAFEIANRTIARTRHWKQQHP